MVRIHYGVNVNLVDANQSWMWVFARITADTGSNPVGTTKNKIIMKSEELEKLCQERGLIKQLIRLDRPRYSHLEARSHEIKIKVNSEYGLLKK